MSEQATRKQLDKINEIQEAVNRLPKEYFREDSINKDGLFAKSLRLILLVWMQQYPLLIRLSSFI